MRLTPKQRKVLLDIASRTYGRGIADGRTCYQVLFSADHVQEWNARQEVHPATVRSLLGEGGHDLICIDSHTEAGRDYSELKLTREGKRVVKQLKSND